jgi:DMSO/TMAO reductase YedYZ molybdopterin-dependent catalytic subunit
VGKNAALRRGAAAGGVAGVVTLAAMYAASAVVGVKPLPDLLSQPVLALMPGPVFGFLIDRLQHAGKVLEEAGLVVVLVFAFAALGVFYAWLEGRRPFAYSALAVSALGWLVVVLVLLPLSGDGLLGLAEGLTTPIVWALLFVVYAVVLQLTAQPAGDAIADPGRRRVLTLIPIGLAAGGLTILGFRLVPEWYRAIASPPESGLAGPSPELTPVRNFYVVSKNFSDPVVRSAGWSLAVRGLVEQPFRLTYSDLTSMPVTTEVVTLSCVSNDVGGPLISTGTFGGVALRDLVQQADPRPQAAAVLFEASDGYAESLPLATVMGDPTILVAHQLDGQSLPNAHGFPARVIIPGRYGMKGPKWLTVIQLASAEENGYWEGQGWDRDAVVKTTSRFDAPRDLDIVKLGPVDLAGIAYAGTRGVSAVEFSSDGGHDWSPATLKPPLSALAWTLWSATWTPPAEGAYTLQVRARDGNGDLQSGRVAPSYPNGASGYHTIHVNVAK